ncbi:MAG TPA: hypothetical protein DCY13_16740, partial [Verrucomicrobiales bacterium]|nr:hypothetical protein [Verrucomicrobiales bacterium]
MPVSRSPVEFFRNLLEATPAEVEQLLKDRTVEQRRVIDQKLVEYRLLPPPIREWRLKATELRWYLLPLMKLRPEARGALMLTVPEVDRPLVEIRLRQWDLLGEQEREEMLASETALRYLARPVTPPSIEPGQLNLVSAEERAQIERTLAHWRSLPEPRRQQLAGKFGEFFTLSTAEKNRTLGLFTASERAQMQLTLQSFASLPPAERDQCL